MNNRISFMIICTAIICCATGAFSAGHTGNRHLEPGDPAPAAVVFCSEIDDNWNPVNPVTTIKAGEGVNFLVKLEEGLMASFVIWDMYKVGADGKDAEPFNNLQMNSSDPYQKFRKWGTTEQTYFPTAGRYRVYMYPKNMNSDNFKSGNWENYSAVGELVVE